MHGPEILVPLGFFAMIAIVAHPLVQAIARRMEQKSAPRVPSDVTTRLERMEQAIDAIAVEVERISEGQRFTTRLLADRSAVDVAGARLGRVAAGGDR